MGSYFSKFPSLFSNWGLLRLAQHRIQTSYKSYWSHLCSDVQTYFPKKLSLLHRRHPSAVCGGSVNIDKIVRNLQKCGKDEGIQTVRAVNDSMIINVNSLREYLNITGHIRQEMNVWAEKMSQLPHKTSLQGGGRSISIAESQIKVSVSEKSTTTFPDAAVNSDTG